MKQRSFFSVLSAIVLVLLLIGAGGVYAFITTGPLSLIRGQAEINVGAAMFVPRQAPVMASLLVNVDKLEGFGRLTANPGNRGRVRAELNQIKQSLLANTDLDYSKDIQPWLGDEITFAVTTLDVDRDRANGRQSGYLVAVATRDPQRSREFLELLWANKAYAGLDLVFEQYQGVKLIYSQQAKLSPTQDSTNLSPLSGTWATAVVGDRFVLFANHPKVLRDAINNVQASNLNLSSDPAYQQALNKMPPAGIGLTFVNVDPFAAWISNPPLQTANKPDVQKSPFLSNRSASLGIALGLNQQGLLAQTVWNPITDSEFATTLPKLSQPVEALQYLPAATAFTVAGADLDRLWNQFSQQVSEDELIGSIVRQTLANVRSRSGIDLPQNIFSWVQGEYALGLLPRSSHGINRTKDFDWIFVAEKAASAPANEGIDEIDAIAQRQGFSIGPLTLDDRQISAWTKLTTAMVDSSNPAQGSLTLRAVVEGVHATVGKYEIFTSSIETMDAAIKAPATGSILASEGFKAAIASLPPINNGYLYLDWLTSQGFLERRLPVLKLIEFAGKPIIEHLRSISLSSSGEQAQEPRADIFIRLGT